MQKAAIQVMEEYEGKLPEDYETLLHLKGIGNYTAGAIASIAYQKPVPAVDGNVLRILTRVSADNTDLFSISPLFRRSLFSCDKESNEPNVSIMMSEMQNLVVHLENMPLLYMVINIIWFFRPYCNKIAIFATRKFKTNFIH